MEELERANKRLAELNKLIEEAEHPGAYINTLAEERREVKLSIKMLESTGDWIIVVTECNDCGGASRAFGHFKDEAEALDEMKQHDYNSSLCTRVSCLKVEGTRP